MPPPEPLVRLVSSARRRLWASRLVGEITFGLGVGAAGAAAVWGVSQVVVFPWADGVSAVLILVAVVATLGWWAAHRPTCAEAALWADHRLGAEDRLATAWEISQHPRLGAAAIRQIEAAGNWAAGAERGGLKGEYPSARTIGLAVVAVGSALLVAMSPSVTDQAVAESRLVRQVVDQEVEAIETLASQGPEELTQRLTELAERLGETHTLEEALSVLSSARLELEQRLGPSRLAENTALAGLASRLAQHPIGRGDDPASQLEDLAASLGGISSAQRRAAAQELADRAADFAGINEELAAALGEAASALSDESLDTSQVSEALGRAAAQVSAAQQTAVEASSRAAAAAQLAEAEVRLRNAQRGESKPGFAAGRGSGQGQGSGQGEGQGDASGRGQGQGSGSGSGAGGGGQTGTSGAAGGSVSGVGDNDPTRSPEYSFSVFEPPAGGLAEQVRVPIAGNDLGEVAGSSSAPSVANAALIPYTERFAEYRSAALESLERRSLPSHLTEIVRSYFTELEP